MRAYSVPYKLHILVWLSHYYLTFMPITRKILRNYCPVHCILIRIVVFPLLVLKTDLTDHCLMKV